MRWPLDERTAQAADAYPLLKDATVPSPQFQGRNASKRIWDSRVVQPSTWGTGSILSSPEAIIDQFKGGHYTQGLALVVSWGLMWRQPASIYGDRQSKTIEHIERTLRECAEQISKSQSIADSWQMLTGLQDGGLRWSAVMASKTLHFLCRALGFQQDPPVPIDTAWIRKRVWPAFCSPIPFQQRPDNWEGNTFEAYCRYMTAIRTWAGQKQWTTTQVEATLMNVFEGG